MGTKRPQTKKKDKKTEFSCLHSEFEGISPKFHVV